MNLPFEPNAILLRYGEVAIKSPRKRPFFERLYVSAIKEVIDRHGVVATVKNYGGRFIVHANQATELVDSLKSVPGIQSYSLSRKVIFSSLDDLASQVSVLIKSLVENKTFAIRARRVGKHDFSSIDLAKAIAEPIFDFSSGVNLSHPDQEIFIEVRDDEAFVYIDKVSCVGGMPPTSSGRAIALFSGGIDSPVACYSMLKRGCALDYIYIDLADDDQTFASIAKLFAYISSTFSFNYNPVLYRVSGKELVRFIHEKVSPCLRQIALKIAFYSIAHWFEEQHSYSAVVTGESLAQKSSQTLASLSCIDSRSDAFVLRPLIASDKVEITNIASKIGTFYFSQCVKEYCDLSEGQNVTATPLKKDMDRIPDFSEFIAPFCQSADKYTVESASEFIASESSLSKEYVLSSVCLDTRRTSVAKADVLNNVTLRYFFDLAEDIDLFSSTDESLNSFLSSKNSYIFICEHGVRARSLVSLCAEKGISAKACSVEEYKRIITS